MKKIILAVAALCSVATGFSQEKALKQYSFGDNWFLQGQLGGSYTFSENSRKASVGKLISPHVAIATGKFFSPQIGARLHVSGWESKSYLMSTHDTYKYNYLHASVDGLLNLTNLFTPYQGDRMFNLYGIAGVGYLHAFKKSEYGVGTSNHIVPRVGLQADFRLNSDISLNLEANANLMSDKFNGRVGGTSYDGTLNALVGITYRFNKNGFELVDVVNPAEIDDLNRKINDNIAKLREKDRELQRYKDEVDRLSAQPQVIKEVKEETEVLMNAVVVFRIGSAKLEQNQDINVFNAARYLQDNPKVKVTVTGYADKSTGNATINQRLSEQRAQAVADILIQKYNISSDRIAVRASGDKEQPFPTDAWNRVVVFTAQ